ncbi:hypothetical protein GE115_03160 [Agromyces sp. CFH 90414]|uniref:Uncharacterized protein n=1 Tax=Agromyces agglutinans TaxID=2662258 RepID=A0A6I2FA98_9MICO|nr:hypothetical protein [Agromyces agglutinans]MRG58873.1 hypothetical protein [Agromyces agglutinans]
MTDHARPRPQVVRGYLRELDDALAGVPDALRRDVLDGVAGDLDGLDPAAAAARIEQLGDPAHIAAETRAGLEARVASERPTRVEPAAPEPAASAATDAGSAVVSRGWFVVITALLVAFGGFIVPLVGWIVGLVLMWMSAAWRRWEKWTATLVPVGLVAVVAMFQAIGSWIDQANQAAVDPGFSAPVMPWSFQLWTSLATLPFVMVAVGIWLLVRGLRSR